MPLISIKLNVEMDLPPSDTPDKSFYDPTNDRHNFIINTLKNIIGGVEEGETHGNLWQGNGEKKGNWNIWIEKLNRGNVKS